MIVSNLVIQIYSRISILENLQGCSCISTLNNLQVCSRISTLNNLQVYPRISILYNLQITNYFKESKLLHVINCCLVPYLGTQDINYVEKQSVSRKKI